MRCGPWKAATTLRGSWRSPRRARSNHQSGSIMTKVPEEQVAGVFHRRVGDIVVTAISDGFLDGALDVLRNISPDEARGILAESFRPARRTAVNAFLVYSAGRLCLIETGSGNYLL